MSVEQNPESSPADMCRYFTTMWEDRAQFWRGFLDGSLPGAELEMARRARMNRSAAPEDSAKEALAFAEDLAERWSQRLKTYA